MKSFLRSTRLIDIWQERGILQPGKERAIIKKEASRLKLDLTGLSEIHWNGCGHFTTREGNIVYYSGNTNESWNGVAKSWNNVILSQTVIISIKLNARLCKLNIIQVYVSTAAAPEAEFYEQLKHITSRIPNRGILIIQGHFNAKIGNTTQDTHIRHIRVHMA